MTDEPITYANASTGVPPDFASLVVVDLRTGEEVKGVVVVDTRQGELVRLRTTDDPPWEGPGPMPRTIRIQGRFEIRRRPA